MLLQGLNFNKSSIGQRTNFLNGKIIKNTVFKKYLTSLNFQIILLTLNLNISIFQVLDN